MSRKRLMRSKSRGKLAGVCAGLADYFEVDVAFVRAAWMVLSIVPGAIVGGVLAYLAAWMVMPLAGESATAPMGPRLTRSLTDRKVAGVCGGLAEYFGVDATLVRLVWVVLSIVCGAVVGGMIAYAVAWFAIPKSPTIDMTTAAPVSTT